VPHGGWFPLGVGVVIFVILNTWRRGSDSAVASRIAVEGPLQAFVDQLRAMDPPAARVPGTAIYLNSRRETTPLALRANAERTRAIHEAVVIISIETTQAPHVSEQQRLVVDQLGYEDDGISHLTARFGFQDVPDVPAP